MTSSAAGDGAEEGHVHKIAYDILRFLANLVRDQPCYPALCDFVGFFTKLMPLCGDRLEKKVQEECELIEALAAISASSDALPDFDIFSIFVANPFCIGRCYISFVIYRAQRVFEAARLEKDHVLRVAMLIGLRLLDSSLPANIIDERETAISLFNTKETISDRAKIMASTGLHHAAVIAVAWDPSGPMGCIAMLLQESPPPFKRVFSRSLKRPPLPSRKPAC